MLSQVILNGCVTGLILALPAIALTLTYSIMQFPNFAVGATLTAGAYLAYALNGILKLPLLAAGLGASAGLALLLAAMDRAVFSKLRDRTPIVLLVASIGVAFVLENTVRFIFGNSARSFDLETGQVYEFAGVRLNPEQGYAAITVITALAAMYVLLNHSALGRAMRAVADNGPLAAVRGINREAVIRKAWAVAGLLTGAASVLAGLDRAIDPELGSSYLISVFAAAILGGLGSAAGAVLGAILIGLMEELSTLIVSPNYREATGFAAIALILLLRPQGLFGKPRIRK
jgi:branched-subunit amino acid ABC-type transport system permease component